MAALAWPSILVPSSEAWNPNAGASRSGGRSLANQEQIVTGPSGYVTASLTIPCNNRAKVLAMRALLAGLDGRAGTVPVGPFEVTRAPWFTDPLTGGRITACRGDADAQRDPAWDANLDTSADLDFKLGLPGAMNATTLTIAVTRGGRIEPGMMLSLGERLHVVTAVPNQDVAAPNGPGGATIQVRPWLRADYPAGTVIEFARPVCLMRLASDDTGALELQLSRSGVVSIDLVEAF